MDSVRVHRFMKRAAPFLPLAILVLTLLVLTVHPLPGCRDNGMEGCKPAVLPDGTPIIRVSLTDASVSSANISASGSYSLSVDGVQRISSSAAMHDMPVSRTGGIWAVGTYRVDGREVVLAPRSRGYVKLNGKPYRGELHLLATGSDTFRVINYVDVESYLAGVLARELYAGWHEQTFRAQAIAARTYAMYHMLTAGKGREFDIGIGQAWQVYEGIQAETQKSWKAVESTFGWTLAYGQEGREKIFQAFYSACNGGYVNGVNIMRKNENIPPLQGGQQDDDGRKCPKFTWPAIKVSKADIFAAIVKSYGNTKDLGGVQEIRVKTQTPYGRAVLLEIAGTNGNTTSMLAEDLRVAMIKYGIKGLYSMNCKMRDAGGDIEFYDGRGFGHGVGMSQWGAEDKAARGWTGEQILNFYYPGAKIVKAY